MNEDPESAVDLAVLVGLDADLDDLARGLGDGHDPTFAALAAFVRDVDRRSSILIGTAASPSALAATPEPVDDPTPARARGLWLRPRAAAVAAGAVLAISGAGAAAALSTSPRATLYPLHRVLFGAVQADPASRLETDLAALSADLRQLSGATGADRLTVARRAQSTLVDAQHQLLLTSPSDRMRLQVRVTAVTTGLMAALAPPASQPTPTPGPERSEAPGRSEAPETTTGADGTEGTAGSHED